MANRKKQIEALQKKASALAEEVQAVHDEMEEAADNMPDGIRYNSTRGTEMDERLDLLSTFIDALEEFADETL